MALLETPVMPVTQGAQLLKITALLVVAGAVGVVTLPFIITTSTSLLLLKRGRVGAFPAVFQQPSEALVGPMAPAVRVEAALLGRLVTQEPPETLELLEVHLQVFAGHFPGVLVVMQGRAAQQVLVA